MKPFSNDPSPLGSDRLSAPRLRELLAGAFAGEAAEGGPAREESVALWARETQWLSSSRRLSIAADALRGASVARDSPSFLSILDAVGREASAEDKDTALTGGLMVAAQTANASLCAQLMARGAQCKGAPTFIARRDPMSAMTTRPVLGSGSALDFELVAKTLAPATDFSRPSDHGHTQLMLLAGRAGKLPPEAEIGVAAAMLQSDPSLLSRVIKANGCGPLAFAVDSGKHELADFLAGQMSELEISGQIERLAILLAQQRALAKANPQWKDPEEAERAQSRALGWAAQWERGKLLGALAAPLAQAGVAPSRARKRL